MIIFAPIQGLLDILSEQLRINIVKQIKASDDVIVFPQGLFGLISSMVGGKFSGNNALSSRFACQKRGLIH